MWRDAEEVLAVDLIKEDDRTTVLSRTGRGYFKPGIEREVVEAVRKAI